MSHEASADRDSMPAILTERRGTTLAVTINRPEVRNALDAPAAAALARAFRDFDRDDTLAVAVLCGSAGTFCAGFDLKSVAADGADAPLVNEGGDGPLGVTRMLLSKPVI